MVFQEQLNTEDNCEYSWYPSKQPWLNLISLYTEVQCPPLALSSTSHYYGFWVSHYFISPNTSFLVLRAGEYLRVSDTAFQKGKIILKPWTYFLLSLAQMCLFFFFVAVLFRETLKRNVMIWIEDLMFLVKHFVLWIQFWGFSCRRCPE